AAIGAGLAVGPPLAVLVEPGEAATEGSGPQCAVRVECQRPDAIVRQAAIGAGLAVGPPLAVLVEPGEAAAAGSGPQRAVRAECQRHNGIARQITVFRGENCPDRNRFR